MGLEEIHRRNFTARKLAAKKARLRRHKHRHHRKRRLTQRQKAAIRKMAARGLFSKIARLRSEHFDSPEALAPGTIRHPHQYVTAVMETGGSVDTVDAPDAREFVKSFLDTDPVFTNTTAGLTALMFETYMIDTNHPLFAQLVETYVEPNSDDFLATFQGKLDANHWQRVLVETASFVELKILIHAGQKSGGGEISDVTIVQGLPVDERQAPDDARQSTLNALGMPTWAGPGQVIAGINSAGSRNQTPWAYESEDDDDATEPQGTNDNGEFQNAFPQHFSKAGFKGFKYRGKTTTGKATTHEWTKGDQKFAMTSDKGTGKARSSYYTGNSFVSLHQTDGTDDGELQDPKNTFPIDTLKAIKEQQREPYFQLANVNASSYGTWYAERDPENPTTKSIIRFADPNGTTRQSTLSKSLDEIRQQVLNPAALDYQELPAECDTVIEQHLKALTTDENTTTTKALNEQQGNGRQQRDDEVIYNNQLRDLIEQEQQKNEPKRAEREYVTTQVPQEQAEPGNTIQFEGKAAATVTGVLPREQQREDGTRTVTVELSNELDEMTRMRMFSAGTFAKRVMRNHPMRNRVGGGLKGKPLTLSKRLRKRRLNTRFEREGNNVSVMFPRGRVVTEDDIDEAQKFIDETSIDAVSKSKSVDEDNTWITAFVADLLPDYGRTDPDDVTREAAIPPFADHLAEWIVRPGGICETEQDALALLSAELGWSDLTEQAYAKYRERGWQPYAAIDEEPVDVPALIHHLIHKATDRKTPMSRHVIKSVVMQNNPQGRMGHKTFDYEFDKHVKRGHLKKKGDGYIWNGPDEEYVACLIAPDPLGEEVTDGIVNLSEHAHARFDPDEDALPDGTHAGVIEVDEDVTQVELYELGVDGNVYWMPIDTVSIPEKVQYADRYTALGIPHPDPKTVCRGPCEGTGWVPVTADAEEPQARQRWQQAEAEKHTNDGYHFVKCWACEGTGLLPGLKRPVSEALITSDELKARFREWFNHLDSASRKAWETDKNPNHYVTQPDGTVRYVPTPVEEDPTQVATTRKRLSPDVYKRTTGQCPDGFRWHGKVSHCVPTRAGLHHAGRLTRLAMAKGPRAVQRAIRFRRGVSGPSKASAASLPSGGAPVHHGKPRGKLGALFHHGVDMVAGPFVAAFNVVKDPKYRKEVLGHIGKAIATETKETGGLLRTFGKALTGRPVTPQEKTDAINQTVDLIKVGLGTAIVGHVAAAGVVELLKDLAMPYDDVAGMLMDKPLRRVTEKYFGPQHAHGLLPSAFYAGKPAEGVDEASADPKAVLQRLVTAIVNDLAKEKLTTDDLKEIIAKSPLKGDQLAAVLTKHGININPKSLAPKEQTEAEDGITAFTPQRHGPKKLRHQLMAKTVPQHDVVTHKDYEMSTTATVHVEEHPDAPGKFRVYYHHYLPGKVPQRKEETIAHHVEGFKAAQSIARNHLTKVRAAALGGKHVMSESVNDAVSMLPPYVLTEMSLSRIVRHTQEGKGYVIMSADRSERSRGQNAGHRKQLTAHLRKQGYGYTHVRGGYIEQTANGPKPVYEHSIMVHNVSRKGAKKIAKYAYQHHRQEAVLHVHPAKGANLHYGATGKHEKVGDHITTGNVPHYFTEWHKRRFGFKSKLAASVGNEGPFHLYLRYVYSTEAPIEEWQKDVAFTAGHARDVWGNWWIRDDDDSGHTTIDFPEWEDRLDGPPVEEDDDEPAKFPLNADGQILQKLAYGATTVEECNAGLRMLRKNVEASLKWLEETGYAAEQDGKWSVTAKGGEVLKQAGMDRHENWTDEDYAAYRRLLNELPERARDGSAIDVDDPPDFTLKDVQTYFDLRVLDGDEQEEAISKTKKKFKIKDLTVSPTMEVHSDEVPADDSAGATATFPVSQGGDEPDEIQGGDGNDQQFYQPTAADPSNQPPDPLQQAGLQQANQQQQTQQPPAGPTGAQT